MSPLEVIAAINAALALIKALMPALQELVKSGAITVAEQAELRAKYDALAEQGAAAFSGAEWKT